MGAPLCKLSLICPSDLKVVLCDLLEALDDLVPGYTMLGAEGRGASMELASAAERVSGAMKVVQFEMVVLRQSIDTILDRIARGCSRRQIAYWITPIDDYGRLV